MSKSRKQRAQTFEAFEADELAKAIKAGTSKWINQRKDGSWSTDVVDERETAPAKPRKAP